MIQNQIPCCRCLPEIAQIINVVRGTVVPDLRNIRRRNVMLVVRGFIELERVVITGIGRFRSAIEAVGRCRALRWMMGTIW